MADAPLERNVADELLWDPRIDNEMIAVSADNGGTITLRGTVGSFRRSGKLRRPPSASLESPRSRTTSTCGSSPNTAARMANCVPTSFRRSCSTRLCRPPIEASVKDGFVTLTGSADWQYQRERPSSSRRTSEG